MTQTKCFPLSYVFSVEIYVWKDRYPIILCQKYMWHGAWKTKFYIYVTASVTAKEIKNGCHCKNCVEKLWIWLSPVKLSSLIIGLKYACMYYILLWCGDGDCKVLVYLFNFCKKYLIFLTIFGNCVYCYFTFYIWSPSFFILMSFCVNDVFEWEKKLIKILFYDSHLNIVSLRSLQSACFLIKMKKKCTNCFVHSTRVWQWIWCFILFQVFILFEVILN